ncbi:hypothetical protein GDO81_023120 [Engystomops pustulosus]|uniref:Uncharacterized protein n=1 Tax=Engystomops pustulosus TaxID=76066 RepID=A0AAV6YMQ4_ENGPU|nr:hypothetical protein GDO81_023120 [Engystomops pustulosus]
MLNPVRCPNQSSLLMATPPDFCCVQAGPIHQNLIACAKIPWAIRRKTEIVGEPNDGPLVKEPHCVCDMCMFRGNMQSHFPRWDKEKQTTFAIL